MSSSWKYKRYGTKEEDFNFVDGHEPRSNNGLHDTTLNSSTTVPMLMMADHSHQDKKQNQLSFTNLNLSKEYSSNATLLNRLGDYHRQDFRGTTGDMEQQRQNNESGMPNDTVLSSPEVEREIRMIEGVKESEAHSPAFLMT